MAAVLDYVSDWRSRLLSRLYVQFKDDPTWQLWCTDVLGPQFQDLEDAGQTLLAFWSIDDVAGLQLELIGRVVKQPRGGVDDPTYRLRLRARIAANRSDGGPDAIYRVFSFLFPGHALRLAYSPIKSLAMTISGAISHTDGLVGVDFLGSAKEAGVRALLEWQEQDDSLTFTTAKSTTCRIATIIGATSMSVDPRQVTDWPATGSVQLDGTTATQETIAYTSIVSSGHAAVINFAGGLTKAHAVGSEIELTTDPGLGWGSDVNPLIGGEFATAQQAA